MAFKYLTVNDPRENMRHTQGRDEEWTGKFVEFVAVVCDGLALPISEPSGIQTREHFGKRNSV